MECPGSIVLQRASAGAGVRANILNRKGARSSWPTFAIVGLLLAVHLWVGSLIATRAPSPDGAEYLRLGENLLALGQFTYDGANPVVGKAPGFPFLIAGYLAVVGGTQGLLLVQMLLLFGSYLAVAAVTRELCGHSWSLVVLAFLVAIDPLRDLSREMLSEPLFLILSSWAIYSTVRLLKSGRWGWAMVAGLLSGTSAYVRPVSLLWPLVPLAMGARSRRLIRWQLVVVALLHLAILAPWMIRNDRVFNRVVPMVANWGPLYYMTDSTLWYRHLLYGRQAIDTTQQFRQALAGEFEFNWGPNERYWQMARENIISDPIGYLGRCSRQLLYVWSYMPGTKSLAADRPLLFLAGRSLMILFYLLMLWGARNGVRSHPWVVGLCIGYAVYTALIHFPVHTESRYLIPAYMWLLPLTVAGAKTILEPWLAARSRESSKAEGDCTETARQDALLYQDS